MCTGCGGPGLKRPTKEYLGTYIVAKIEYRINLVVVVMVKCKIRQALGKCQQLQIVFARYMLPNALGILAS